MTVTCPVCKKTIGDDESICPYCGYKMRDVTESFKPVKVEKKNLSEVEKPVKSAELRVVRGPQTGVVIELTPGTLSIGRNLECDVFLNDMTVSREHAEVEVGPDGCFIRDTHSFNGVWVNNNNVEAYKLENGDVIQIGAFCLIYQEK